MSSSTTREREREWFRGYRHDIWIYWEIGSREDCGVCFWLADNPYDGLDGRSVGFSSVVRCCHSFVFWLYGSRFYSCFLLLETCPDSMFVDVQA